MLIPSRIANNIRTFEHSLLSTDHENRGKGFYIAIRPILKWVKPYLVREGLTSDEAESELYLLSADLLKGYNPNRSSLVPYVQRQTLWYMEAMSKRVKRFSRFDYEELGGYDKTYELKDEIYLATPQILFEERYIGKVLDRTEKFIVSQILESDSKELSQAKLAKRLDIDRKTMRKKLLDIAVKLGGFND